MSAHRVPRETAKSLASRHCLGPQIRCRPCRRDANTISAVLHDLIAVAGVERPFILMGHSIAGLYLRSYARHFPNAVAGLVFVDGATPLQNDRVPAELIKLHEAQRRRMPWRNCS